MRSDGYKSKPTGEKGIYNFNTLTIIEQQKQKAGRKLPRTSLAVMKSTSKNFGAPAMQGEQGMRSPLEHRQTSRWISATRRPDQRPPRTPSRINLISLRRNWHWIGQQLRSLLQKSLKNKESEENPQEWSGVFNIFLKGQVVGNLPCKNKQPHNREDANHDVHIRITMGVKDASPINPEKVRAGKCKTNYSDRLRAASNEN